MSFVELYSSLGGKFLNDFKQLFSHIFLSRKEQSETFFLLPRTCQTLALFCTILDRYPPAFGPRTSYVQEFCLVPATVFRFSAVVEEQMRKILLQKTLCKRFKLVSGFTSGFLKHSLRFCACDLKVCVNEGRVGPHDGILMGVKAMLC